MDSPCIACWALFCSWRAAVCNLASSAKVHELLKAIVVITMLAHRCHDFIYFTPILCLWDLCTLCAVDHLWLEHFLHSLVPATCNRISRTQVHELLQGHCCGNQKGTLFSWSHIYYVHLLWDLSMLCVVDHLLPLILSSLLSLLSILWFISTSNV